jgi:hypothetical protein
VVWGLPFDRRSSDLGYLEVAPQWFASAVIAKGIVFYQTRQDLNSKSGTSAAAGTANAMSTTVAAAPSAADIFNGDSNGPSRVDTQYSVFSLIAIFYFVGLFVANLNLYAADAVTAGKAGWFPQIPPALLGLTSLAALTHVGNKAVQTQGLRVVSFSPNPVPVSSPVLLWRRRARPGGGARYSH